MCFKSDNFSLKVCYTQTTCTGIKVSY